MECDGMLEIKAACSTCSETRWENVGGESFSDVFFDVTILSGPACPCVLFYGEGLDGGLGSDVPFDVGPDDLWSPGELVTHTFEIRLTTFAPLSFFGDVFGIRGIVNGVFHAEEI